VAKNAKPTSTIPTELAIRPSLLQADLRKTAAGIVLASTRRVGKTRLSFESKPLDENPSIKYPIASN
jgi:hypothetical protein